LETISIAEARSVASFDGHRNPVAPEVKRRRIV